MNTCCSTNYDTHRKSSLPLGQSFLKMLLMIIPIVNLILLLVWSLGDNAAMKKNSVRTMLIVMLIGLVVSGVTVATYDLLS